MMKKIIFLLQFVFTSNVFANDRLCDIEHILSMEQIQHKLMMQGYRIVRDLQLDDCLYEAKVRDKNNDNWEVQVNPKNGKVIGKERDNFLD